MARADKISQEVKRQRWKRDRPCAEEGQEKWPLWPWLGGHLKEEGDDATQNHWEKKREGRMEYNRIEKLETQNAIKLQTEPNGRKRFRALCLMLRRNFRSRWGFICSPIMLYNIMVGWSWVSWSIPTGDRTNGKITTVEWMRIMRNGLLYRSN